ncbi:Formin-binding protein 1 [Chytriomyces hyalinus]|nr:Formin-binding protein 1 [Chytriomyces hyalinus]
MSLDFGLQLWDQWLEVETLMQSNAKSLETLGDYFRRRAEIELEYARSLSKLAKPHKDEITRLATEKRGTSQSTINRALLASSTLQAWSQLLNETENRAKIHLTFSEKLDLDVKKLIKSASTQFESKLKISFDEMKTATSELQKSMAATDKLREKYEADRKLLEPVSGSAFDKLLKTAKPLDLDEKEMEKRRLAVKQSLEIYQSALADLNTKKNETYMQIVPNLLNQVCKHDHEIRFKAFETTFRYYFTATSDMQPHFQSGLDAMNTVSGAMNIHHDQETFVRLLKSGEPVPPDFVFEEKVSGAGGFEITGRRLLRSPSALRFERDEAGPEVLCTQPHKQGKKPALDKLKVYDKEQVELQKKLESLETLLKVYPIEERESNRNAVVQQLLQHQKTLEVRLTNVGLRKHALQVYTAEADGLKPPPLPSYLVGKSVTSPVITSPSHNRFPASSPSLTTASFLPPPNLAFDVPDDSSLHLSLKSPNFDSQESAPLSAGSIQLPAFTTANIAPKMSSTNEDDDQWTWHQQPATLTAEQVHFTPPPLIMPELVSLSISQNPSSTIPPSEVLIKPPSLKLELEDDAFTWFTNASGDTRKNEPIDFLSTQPRSQLTATATPNFVLSSTISSEMAVSDLKLPRSAIDYERANLAASAISELQPPMFGGTDVNTGVGISGEGWGDAVPEDPWGAMPFSKS